MPEQWTALRPETTLSNSLVVTDGDRVLCENCYQEQQNEQDPATYFYAHVKHGVCDCCGLEIKKENVKMTNETQMG
ncbi:MAG: hypothetical protein AB7U29_18465 [Desulfobulbus sp.]